MREATTTKGVIVKTLRVNPSVKNQGIAIIHKIAPKESAIQQARFISVCRTNSSASTEGKGVRNVSHMSGVNYLRFPPVGFVEQ